MTKTKFFTVIGAATLLLGFGLNLQYALDDYGFTKNSLSGFMLVQAADTTYAGPAIEGVQKDTPRSKCIITTPSSTTSGNTSSNSTGIGGQGGGTSNGNTTTTVITWVTVYYCGVPKANETCYNYNPCGALGGVPGDDSSNN